LKLRLITGVFYFYYSTEKVFYPKERKELRKERHLRKYARKVAESQSLLPFAALQLCEILKKTSRALRNSLRALRLNFNPNHKKIIFVNKNNTLQ